MISPELCGFQKYACSSTHVCTHMHCVKSKFEDNYPIFVIPSLSLSPRHVIGVVDKMSTRLKPNCGEKRTSFAYMCANAMRNVLMRVIPFHRVQAALVMTSEKSLRKVE